MRDLIRIDYPATRRLSHVQKDESFSGLDPINPKPKPKYKKSAYESRQKIVLQGVKQLHVRYRSEHALELLGREKDQRSKNSTLSSCPEELAADTAKSSYNSSAITSTAHQTFDSPVPNTVFEEEHLESLLSTLSHLSIQTEAIVKISTLNSHLYDPGSVDSARSTPTESLSTTSSPVLQQAHPVLFPDSFNQGGRRSSVISLDSTLAPSSPRPTNKKRGRQSVQPSQGDAVLISFLGPDQPHVAIRAGESPLPWPSGSESTETEMEGGSGGHDGEGGGESGHSSRSVSRQQSSEGLRGSGNGGSGNGSTTNGGSTTGSGGGGGGRKENSGNGKENGNGGGNGEEKKENKKKKKTAKEQLTSEADAMDIDEGSQESPTNEGQPVLEQEDAAKGSIPTGRGGSNHIEVEVSSSETAVGGLMALAGAAGKDQQPFSSGATLSGLFPIPSAAPWAPTAHAQTSPGGTDRGPLPSPGSSNQLFQGNKLPLPNSPPPLPSMIPSMNTQSASSPNSLPSGNDGRHTTLPPVSSIHVLADIAEKESSHQQQSSRGYANRMPPNPRTVYPTVSSHVSVAPSNRSAQAAQSPGLPPPGQAAHGYGPDGNPRPPMHHMSVQQRQYYMSQDSPPTPYYPQHQHYHAYTQLKEVSQGSPNSNSGPYAPTFPNGRELPNIMSSPPPTGTNFFAQPHTIPTSIMGRRDSTMESYYGSDPPSGPSTGDTMPSSGTDDTVTSPRNRPGVSVGGMQGGPLTTGVFKCDFAGCKAQAFQTQYLLK